MLDDLRKYVESGIAALSGQSSEDLAGTLMTRAQGAAEQFTALAAGLVQWSAAAREGLVRDVRDLVARQVEEAGLARRTEVEALRARIQDLERRLPKSPGTGSRPTRAGTASPAKRTRAKSPAKRTRAKSPAKRTRAGAVATSAKGAAGPAPRRSKPR